MTEHESQRWYARNDIARELEIIGGHMVKHSEWPLHQEAVSLALRAVGLSLLEHVDTMRGELQVQADREANEIERERNSTLAPLPVYGVK